MSGTLDRRSFLGKSVGASVGAAIAFNFEEKALLAQAARGAQGQETPGFTGEPFPTGKIGNLTLTRLMGGGNLISGFAHSRDLIYVSALLRQYFTDEKIFETWRLCEQNGLNAMMLRVDDDVIRLVNTYRKEHGGKFHWLAQCKLTEADITVDIARAVDNGAAAAYIHGGVADSLVETNRIDVLEKALEAIHKAGLPAGIGGHSVTVLIACEEAGAAGGFLHEDDQLEELLVGGPDAADGQRVGGDAGDHD
ncbi:MAG TPA: hypothetical protein P5279_10660 [Anaerohalosphaeraceae bacterium]|jgi:hypothetical protein|nr:hypothetical protein [Anaerohalosphaeraceae bacterium]HRT50947.1 hypothetical protein [Anaerohalosphaeraceae bacterium]HRT86592.1 hypothetical protein [Anaerohalosphaeraceae bacterium]